MMCLFNSVWLYIWWQVSPPEEVAEGEALTLKSLAMFTLILFVTFFSFYSFCYTIGYCFYQFFAMLLLLLFNLCWEFRFFCLHSVNIFKLLQLCHIFDLQMYSIWNYIIKRKESSTWNCNTCYSRTCYEQPPLRHRKCLFFADDCPLELHLYTKCLFWEWPSGLP